MIDDNTNDGLVKVKEESDRLDFLGNNINYILDRINKINENIGDLHKEIDEKYYSIRDSVDVCYSEIHGNTYKLTGRINEIESSNVQYKENISKLTSRINEIESGNAQYKEKIHKSLLYHFIANVIFFILFIIILHMVR